MKLDCIPPSLRQLPRWIWWDKQKKPHSAATGELIDPTNPKCGVTYEEAVAARKAAEKLLSYHNNHGLQMSNDYPIGSTSQANGDGNSEDLT